VHPGTVSLNRSTFSAARFNIAGSASALTFQRPMWTTCMRPGSHGKPSADNASRTCLSSLLRDNTFRA
jgi:hypothetical protein